MARNAAASENDAGHQCNVCVRLAFTRAHDSASVAAQLLQRLMTDKTLLAQMACRVKRVDHGQRWRLLFTHFIREHVAFHLHFGEHGVQYADKIRHPMGHRQINEFDPAGTGIPASTIIRISPCPSDATTRDSAILSNGVFSWLITLDFVEGRDGRLSAGTGDG